MENNNNQEKLLNNFNEMMQDENFQEMWNKLHNPWVRNHAKIGRNEPCPCGSGKKYKNCCGKEDKMTYSYGTDQTTTARYIPYGTKTSLRGVKGTEVTLDTENPMESEGLYVGDGLAAQLNETENKTV